MISKYELAELYAQNVDVLFKKIHGNIYLLSELEEVGYIKRSKMLTPLQVAIIFKWLGTPQNK